MVPHGGFMTQGPDSLLESTMTLVSRARNAASRTRVASLMSPG